MEMLKEEAVSKYILAGPQDSASKTIRRKVYNFKSLRLSVFLAESCGPAIIVLTEKNKQVKNVPVNGMVAPVIDDNREKLNGELNT